MQGALATKVGQASVAARAGACSRAARPRQTARSSPNADGGGPEEHAQQTRRGLAEANMCMQRRTTCGCVRTYVRVLDLCQLP